MSPTKLDGNSLISPGRESLVCEIPAGDGKIANFFLQCRQQVQNKLSKHNIKEKGERSVQIVRRQVREDDIDKYA
jgi:hypothetical protein